jgi:Tol biopolymer transport system component
MRTLVNTVRCLFGLTLMMFGLTGWTTLPFNSLRHTAEAAPTAGLTKMTGQPTLKTIVNGRIAFVSDRGQGTNIYTINSDGTDERQLTSGQHDFDPAWSPDGTQIAFVRTSSPCQQGEIFVINADGSNLHKITLSGAIRPTWSPDGTQIAYVLANACGGYNRIAVMNADGSNQHAIDPPLTRNMYDPVWSPAGPRLAVTNSNAIFLLPVDGGPITQLTKPLPNLEYDYAPTWSPDGTKVAFGRQGNCDFFDCYDTPTIQVVNADGPSLNPNLSPTKIADAYANNLAWSPDGIKFAFDDYSDIYVINANGSGLTNLTNTPNASDTDPSWQPLSVTSQPAANPIDDAQFFVRQQYLDFLGRDPDQVGFQNWMATLLSCPEGGYGINHPTCDRVHVAKSFYQSLEFQTRGYWAYRFYETAFGRTPTYAEFIPDIAKVGGPKNPQQEAESKNQYMDEFVGRTEFRQRYDSLAAPAQFIDALLQTAGTPDHPLRGTLISGLQTGQKTRAQVLREIVESKEVEDRFYVRGFVSMMYYGFVRRTPDPVGLDNYVLKLNQTGDPRAMSFDFIYSTEYRARFGQP